MVSTEVEAEPTKKRTLDDLSLRMLVESSPVGMGAVGRDGRLIYANTTLRETLGFEQDEIKGKHVADLVIPSERDNVGSEIDRSIKSSDSPPMPISTILSGRDGGPVYVQILLPPCGQPEERLGRPIYVTNVSEVVSRTRRCYEICTLLEQAFDSANAGMIFAGPDGDVIRVNSKVKELLGVDPQDLRGHDLEHVARTLQDAVDSYPSLADVVRRETAKERTVVVEVKTPRGSSSLQLHMDNVLTSDGSSLGTLATFVDVTSIRRLEQELCSTSRLSFMGRMAASIAHEVNTPLTNIALLEARLRSELGSEDSVVAEMLDSLNEQWNHIHALTSDLLRLSYGGSPGEEVVDVKDLIETVASSSGDIVPAETEISLSPASEPMLVKVDRRGMERVLTSLVTNASESTEGRGSITIGWNPGNRGMVEIWVKDEGSGIEPEHLQRIFEPFFTTKGIGTRSGLGLAIARNIVESHGGKMLVESEVGAGSTVKVLLPRCFRD